VRYVHWSKKGRGLRWWARLGRVKLHVELAWLNSSCGFSFVYDDEYGWGGSLSVPGILSIWMFANGMLPGLPRDREVSLRIFSGAIWWSVWRDWRDGWSRDVPRWRDGNFNFVDFLLGDAKYSTRDIEAREIVVPMPEKSYAATAKLFESTWKRPRWPARKLLRVQIDVPEGIPMEGKGENSWDCGTDATFGITCPANSIAKGVGELVGSALHDRVRYGGWADWTWTKAARP